MSSSLILIHGEYGNGMLALTLAAATFVGYAGSVYWERTVAPRLIRSRELALEREIAKLEREAEEICTTANLYEHSRLTRKALRLRQELQAERRKRLAYECSVARVVSTLLRCVTFALEASQPMGVADAGTAASGPASTTRAGSKQSSLPDPSCTIATPSSMETDRAESSLTALRRRRVLGESAVNLLYYNAVTTVKYLLRFGSVLVLLYIVGDRRGPMAVPSLFEGPLQCSAAKVRASTLLNSFTHRTVTLFAPGSVTPPVENHGSGTPGSVVDVTRGRFAAATTCGDNQLCSSGDLLPWILACYLAAYLVLRVID
ncbi:hypothetical protein LSCM1_02576 [Leishmania martiniquensis]|uniref:Uncharacterized protein n=1 Tax=Leishmania martiniquensis TaxID=1580590 RepID=A0A836H2U1_9TRYP|nr:hypothetical protein LSCM1_02576 [Leishmania martiniquensis]